MKVMKRKAIAAATLCIIRLRDAPSAASAGMSMCAKAGSPTATEPEAREGDPELGGRQEVLQPVLVRPHGLRAPVTLLDELLHAGVPDPSHRQLGRREERVEEDQPDGYGNQQGVRQHPLTRTPHRAHGRGCPYDRGKAAQPAA